MTYLNLRTWGLGLSLMMFEDLEILCNRPKNTGYFGAVGNHKVIHIKTFMSLGFH